MKFPRLRRRPDLMRGATAGLIGGLAGAFAMNQFQSALSKAKENCAGTSGQEEPGDGEDATTKTAEWLLNSVAGVKLSKEQKKTAGPVVHYSFGAAMGALYGALTEYRPRTRAKGGALWGAALFVGADEVALPAFGLSKSPAEYPLSVHASALAAHLVYGMSTELVRQKVRRALLLV